MTDKEDLFIGIDAGTSSIKIGCFDQNGKMRGLVRKEYQIKAKPNGWIELNPEIYWKKTYRGMKEIISKLGGKSKRIRAVSISSQAQTFIAIDKKRKPLQDAIVWLDNRAEKETKYISSQFSKRVFYQVTGFPYPAPYLLLSKLLWLKRSEPYVFKHIYKILQVHDYLLYRFTGNYLSDACNFGMGGCYDHTIHGLWEKGLKKFEIPLDIFPEIRLPGEPVGKILKSIAQKLGLSPEVEFVLGANDQSTSALGMGNINPGQVTEVTGTAMVLYTSIKKPNYNGQYFPWGQHVIKNLNFSLVYHSTAGIILKWLKENIFSCKKYESLLKGVEKIPVGSEGLTFIPHFYGRIFPERAPDSGGALLGLRLYHTRAHIIRAYLESLAAMLIELITLIKAEYKLKISSLRVSGGTNRSHLLCQMKADALGIPVELVKNEDTAVVGGAILAASYFYNENIKNLINRFVGIAGVFTPDISNTKKYQFLFSNIR